MSDNQLIARFMGLHTNTQYGLEVLMPPDNLSAQGYWTNPKYDTSWDWLMPVVEKISQIHDSKFKYDFTQIKQGNWPADNEYMEVIALPLATPILDVHKAVVQFIKWYNQNPTQP